jgi:hypothetical protein
MTQNKATHTPGPWHIEEHKHTPATIVSTGAHRHIEVGCVFYTDLESGAANARLIAAAPDLLEALKAYVHVDNRGGCARDARLFGLAKRAIAKAEGRS